MHVYCYMWLLAYECFFLPRASDQILKRQPRGLRWQNAGLSLGIIHTSRSLYLLPSSVFTSSLLMWCWWMALTPANVQCIRFTIVILLCIRFSIFLLPLNLFRARDNLHLLFMIHIYRPVYKIRWVEHRFCYDLRCGLNSTFPLLLSWFVLFIGLCMRTDGNGSEATCA